MTNNQCLFWANQHRCFRLIFGMLFAFVGAIAGFLIGLAFTVYNEQVSGIGDPQSPLLFLLTAPLGLLAGLLFGAWKGDVLTRRFKAIAKSDA